MFSPVTTGALTSFELTVINSIIINDEGGWKYTLNEYDLGGPTYGGASYRWFSKWYEEYTLANFNAEDFLLFPPSISKDEFRELAMQNDARLQNTIKVFYYYEFFEKLKLNAFSITLVDMLLSCAVNIDAHDAAELMQLTHNKVAYSRISAAEIFSLKVDGIIGTKSTTAINALFTYQAGYSETAKNKLSTIRITINDFKREFIILWLHKYANTIKLKPRQINNLDGWINRATKYLKSY